MTNNGHKYHLGAVLFKSIFLLLSVFISLSSTVHQKNPKAKSKMIKELLVKKINSNKVLDIVTAERIMGKTCEYHPVNILNWEEYSYKPNVKFMIGYQDNSIFLKYTVEEESVRATISEINGNVYKDSCVEFFISTNKSADGYYNFEFNCIGTPLVSYGESRYNRQYIKPETLKLIETQSSLGTEPFGERIGKQTWEIMIIIPKDCFTFDKAVDFSKIEGRANFYKCGDDMVKPHYVSWNPIKTETPDYHQPKYFGKIRFEE